MKLRPKHAHQKTPESANVGKDAEQLGLSHTAGWSVNWYHLDHLLAVYITLSICILYDPEIPLLGKHPT